MSLANLYNPPFGQEEMAFWAFSNHSEHRKAITAANAQKGSALTDRVLSPIALFALSEWLLRHQAMHNEMNSTLKQIGNDLTSVDLNNREQLIGWVELHAAEHRNWNAILGI